jgi:hypothetical protein
MTREQMDALIQAQVDAYNRRDIDGFVATYACDVVVSDRAGVRGLGHDWIRSRYGPMFAAGSSPVAIRGRVIAGDWVVDEELVHGPTGDAHVLVAYRVADGSIAEVLFLTQPDEDADGDQR